MAKPKLSKYEFYYYTSCPLCGCSLTRSAKDILHQICGWTKCDKCYQIFLLATKDTCIKCNGRIDCLSAPTAYFKRKRVRSDSFRKIRKALRSG